MMGRVKRVPRFFSGLILSWLGIFVACKDPPCAAKGKAPVASAVMLAPNVGLAQRSTEAAAVTLPKALDVPGAVY